MRVGDDERMINYEWPYYYLMKLRYYQLRLVNFSITYFGTIKSKFLRYLEFCDHVQTIGQNLK